MFWKYLKYIIRHKWYVFIACCQNGIIWRGIMHDLSKFSPMEFVPYMKHFYGVYYDCGDFETCSGKDYCPYVTKQSVKHAYDIAFLHHQHNNRHHWQYWLLETDAGKQIAYEMPKNVALEMLCDWRGAGMAIGKKSPKDDPWRETREWYYKNRKNIVLHNKTREIIEIKLGTGLIADYGLLKAIIDSHINQKKERMVQQIKDYPLNRYVLEDLLVYLISTCSELDAYKTFARICVLIDICEFENKYKKLRVGKNL